MNETLLSEGRGREGERIKSKKPECWAGQGKSIQSRLGGKQRCQGGGGVGGIWVVLGHRSQGKGWFFNEDIS